MNGPHDLGGQHGFGPIAPEAETEEPVFHADWERRAFALTLACGMHGQWNIDQSRHARECIHPAEYLRNTYYENWIAGLETLIVDHGLITAEELASGEIKAPTSLKAKNAEQIPGILFSGGPSKRKDVVEACYSVGDEVRVRQFNPSSHTRAPRYVRGHVGIIHAHHGTHVFPDETSKGVGGAKAHLYSVQFSGRELWGDEPGIPTDVFVDLWEPYLETP